MELSRKTTILMSPALHDRLVRLAQRRGVSMGHLIRQAVVGQYGWIDADERLEAVRELGALSLPVGSTAAMKVESNPIESEPPP